MQAIETKFYVDNNGNSSIIASCNAGRLKMYIGDINNYISNHLNEYIDTEYQHYITAKELIKKLGWTEDSYGDVVMGCLKNGNYVFVFTGKNNKNMPAKQERTKRK